MSEIIKLPIISMWQPWAQWVIFGWKTIETRLHNRFASLEGRTIGIHSAQKWDDLAIDLAEPDLTDSQKEYTENQMSRKGGFLIGTAFVEKHRILDHHDSQKALIDCYNIKRFGLILSNVTRINPIRMKGKQGIWYGWNNRYKQSLEGNMKSTKEEILAKLRNEADLLGYSIAESEALSARGYTGGLIKAMALITEGWPDEGYWECICGTKTNTLTDDTKCKCNDIYMQDWTYKVLAKPQTTDESKFNNHTNLTDLIEECSKVTGEQLENIMRNLGVALSDRLISVYSEAIATELNKQRRPIGQKEEE